MTSRHQIQKCCIILKSIIKKLTIARNFMVSHGAWPDHEKALFFYE